MKQCNNRIIRMYGFSLVEFLVVGAIFAVVAVMSSSSLFSILRGSAKTDITKEIKQNGDFALSNMEQKFRNGTVNSSFCNGTRLGSITITNSDNSTTTYSCENGRIKQVDTPLSGSQTSSYLTNTSVTTSCNDYATELLFICTNSGSSYPTVKINFTLSQANTTAGAADSSSQAFQTQVTLRNK